MEHQVLLLLLLLLLQAVFVGLLLISGLWILLMTKSPSLFCFWICQWQDECQPAPQLDWHITGAIVCGQEWRSGKIQWSIVTLLHRSLVNPFPQRHKAGKNVAVHIQWRFLVGCKYVMWCTYKVLINCQKQTCSNSPTHKPSGLISWNNIAWN